MAPASACKRILRRLLLPISHCKQSRHKVSIQRTANGSRDFLLRFERTSPLARAPREPPPQIVVRLPVPKSNSVSSFVARRHRRGNPGMPYCLGLSEMRLSAGLSRHTSRCARFLDSTPPPVPISLPGAEVAGAPSAQRARSSDSAASSADKSPPLPKCRR